MSDEWAKLGVAVVTGHTGRYEGCAPGIIGAATLIGVGDEGRYVTPAMAAPARPNRSAMVLFPANQLNISARTRQAIDSGKRTVN